MSLWAKILSTVLVLLSASVAIAVTDSVMRSVDRRRASKEGGDQ